MPLPQRFYFVPLRPSEDQGEYFLLAASCVSKLKPQVVSGWLGSGVVQGIGKYIEYIKWSDLRS